jgi:hypothetical protein
VDKFYLGMAGLALAGYGFFAFTGRELFARTEQPVPKEPSARVGGAHRTTGGAGRFYYFGGGGK